MVIAEVSNANSAMIQGDSTTLNGVPAPEVIRDFRENFVALLCSNGFLNNADISSSCPISWREDSEGYSLEFDAELAVITKGRSVWRGKNGESRADETVLKVDDIIEALSKGDEGALEKSFREGLGWLSNLDSALRRTQRTHGYCDLSPQRYERAKGMILDAAQNLGIEIQ